MTHFACSSITATVLKYISGIRCIYEQTLFLNQVLDKKRRAAARILSRYSMLAELLMLDFAEASRVTFTTHRSIAFHMMQEIVEIPAAFHERHGDFSPLTRPRVASLHTLIHIR